MQLRTIEIDFDIHKMIEAERLSFEEPPHLALRRLLKLPSPPPVEVNSKPPVQGLPFVEEGLAIPHGSDARMSYLRGSQLYEGKFLNGELVVKGKRYSSLSAAAGDLARTRKGEQTSLNGWMYWEVKLPGETKWLPMKELRDNKDFRMKHLGKWM